MAYEPIDTPDRYVDRYVKSLQPPPLPSMHEADAREAALRDDIASGGSVSGFAWNMDRYVTKLQSLVNSGAFAEAKQYYDELQDTVARNRDGLLDLAATKHAGALGDALAKRAQLAVTGGFDGAEVKAYGQTMTLGEVLGAGSSFVKDRSSLEGLGFNSTIAGMFYGRTETSADGTATRQFDDLDRAMMRPFVTPFLNESAKGTAAGVVPNHLQLKQTANAVAELRDDLRGAFGEGAASVVDFVHSTHQESGGAPQALRSIVGIAQAMRTDGLTPRDVADRTLNLYSDLAGSLFGDKKMTGDQRRWFDAALLSTVKTFAANSQNIDLENPAFRRAFKEAANEFRAAFDYGVDIRSSAKGAGQNVNAEIGDYAFRAGTGLPQRPGNIVHALRGVRRGLSNLVTGGSDFTPEAVESLSGRRGERNTVEGRTGGTSGCVGADAIASDAQEFLYRFAVPHAVSHRDVGSALRAAISRRESNAELREGLSDAIGASFHGKSGRLASRILADEILKGVVNGSGVNVQDTITRLAYAEPAFARQYPSAVAAYRAWVAGNVADDDIRAMRAQLVRRNMANGMTEPDAQSRASGLAAILHDMKRSGKDYRAAWRRAMVTMPGYVREIDPRTGKQARDPELNFPVIRRQLIDYDQATGGRYSTDPEVFRKVQADQDGLAKEYEWNMKARQDALAAKLREEQKD